jgi:hypothetical protein
MPRRRWLVLAVVPLALLPVGLSREIDGWPLVFALAACTPALVLLVRERLRGPR